MKQLSGVNLISGSVHACSLCTIMHYFHRACLSSVLSKCMALIVYLIHT